MSSMKSRYTKNLNTKKSNQELFDGFSSGCFFYAHYSPILIEEECILLLIEEECFLPLCDKKGVPPFQVPVLTSSDQREHPCLDVHCKSDVRQKCLVTSSVELEDRIVTAMIKTFTTVMWVSK